jgi:hypothetical protein
VPKKLKAKVKKATKATMAIHVASAFPATRIGVEFIVPIGLINEAVRDSRQV